MQHFTTLSLHSHQTLWFPVSSDPSIHQSFHNSLTPAICLNSAISSHHSCIVLNAFCFTLLLFPCRTVPAIYLCHFLFKGIYHQCPQLSLFWSLRPNVFSFNAYFVTTDENSQNNTGGLGTRSAVCETMMPDELGTFYACFDLNSKSAFKCTPVHWPLFIVHYKSTTDVRKNKKNPTAG